MRTVVADRTCRQCGRIFPGGPRAWYCPECRIERQKERAAVYRKNGYQRQLGSVDFCSVCGKEYVVTGGGQRYCKDCAPDAIRSIDGHQTREWLAENSEKFYAERNERRKKKEETCVICGKVFDPQGTPRKTCSSECRSERERRIQAASDKKRSPRHRNNV